MTPQQTNGYFSRAAVYQLQHKYDLALADYDAILVQNPQSTSAVLKRADIFYQQHKYRTAMLECDRALQMSKGKNKQALELKSAIYLAQGETAKAAAELDKALAQYREQTY